MFFLLSSKAGARTSSEDCADVMAQYQVLMKACTIHLVTNVSLLFNRCLVHNLECDHVSFVNACESFYISFSQDVCANCLVETCGLE